MQCCSEEILAVFADGELEAEEARTLRDHLATCQRCRQLFDALRVETRVLSECLQELPEEAASLPSFADLPAPRPWGHVAVVAILLTIASAAAVWINQLNIPEALQWLNPFTFSGRTNLIVTLTYYLAQGDPAMLRDYAAAVGKILLLLLLGGSALLLARRARPHRTGLPLLITLLALVLPGSALEHRHSEFVTVPASETIDDTLLAAGNTVRVDGVINGDLLVFAQSMEVRGTVKGDLVTFAKRTLVSGTVEGNIYDFSNSLDLDGQLAHNLYGFMQSLHVNDKSHVGGGVLAALGDLSLEGNVNRSVTVYVGNADVSGSIGRDLNMTGDSLTLANTCRIGGSLSARVRDLKKVHIADGATIVGARDVQVRVRRSRFARPSFYFHQALWIAAAVLVGWLCLVLLPSFFVSSVQAVGSGWRSLGLGLAVLAGVPVAMIILAITLVGLPLSLLALELYLAGIYLAKIWVGTFLGRALLKRTAPTTADWMLELFVGVLIITVVGFVPYLGGLVRFAVVLLGMGAFVFQLYRVTRPAIAREPQA